MSQPPERLHGGRGTPCAFIQPRTQEEDVMKRFMERCIRRHPKVTALVLGVDRPRAIDGVIDYFGEQAAPVLVASTGSRTSETHAPIMSAHRSKISR